jgi:dTDP-4-dehydrorhamnose 3,5-epimerase
MKKEPIDNIKDAFVLTPEKHQDSRGFLCELFNSNVDYPTFPNKKDRQINFSKSKKSVLRGIHIAPFCKLVSVLHGSGQDVIIDLRKDSPTYLNTYSMILYPENMTQLFIPAYCGHGFLSLEDDTVLVYLQDGNYDPETHKSIKYDDPEIDVKWINKYEIIVSQKDYNAPLLKNFEYKIK